MTTTQLESANTFGFRHSLRPATTVTSFSVDVVDGNGIEVVAEPVTARFISRSGEVREVAQRTDANGRARFVDIHDADVSHVEVVAGHETTGQIRPAPGARLVIET